MGIDTFTDVRRFAADMEDMLGRIRVEPEGPESGAVRTTACLKDGSTVSAECSAFRGSAGNPMSREERLVKVRDCFRRALSESDTERVLAMLEEPGGLDGRWGADEGVGAGGGSIVSMLLKKASPLRLDHSAIAAAMGFITSSMRFAAAALVPHLSDPAAGFGWSYGAVSFAFSLQWIVLGLVSPYVGWLGDRYGVRWLFLIGGLLFMPAWC